MTETNARDLGLLGPESVAWRVIGHPGALVGGLRSLIMQSLHPLAMAGVAEHSDYRSRPLKRLQRTTAYVAATAFGDTASAQRAASIVNHVHKKVRGIDPITGRPYSADDPETKVWVHIVEWESFLAAYLAFAGPLSRAEQDQYLAEGVRIAALLGTPEELVPDSVAAVEDYYERMRPHLCVSDPARTAIDFVVSPPLVRELMPIQLPLRYLGQGAIAIVPRDLRRIIGIDRSTAIDALAILSLRPTLALLANPYLGRLMAPIVGQETHGYVSSGMRLIPT